MKIKLAFLPLETAINDIEKPLVLLEIQNEAGEKIEVGTWAADGEFEELTLDLADPQPMPVDNPDQALLWPLDAPQPYVKPTIERAGKLSMITPEPVIAQVTRRVGCVEVRETIYGTSEPESETTTCVHCGGSGWEPPKTGLSCHECGGNGYTRKVPVMTHININDGKKD